MDELYAEKLARTAYRAYGNTVGWKNFQGNPMPCWEDLGETIQEAWKAAAVAAVHAHTG